MTEQFRRLDALPDERRALVRQLLGRSDSDHPLTPASDPGQVEAPLTRAQQSMWFLCQLAADPAVYNLPSAVRLRGALDVPALHRALRSIATRHAVLRTVFPAVEGVPRQRALPDAAVALPLTDVSAERDPFAAAVAQARSEGDLPFAPAAAPPWRARLFRLAADDHVLLFVHHHLVWDGWSIGVKVAELAAFYEAERTGRPAALAPLPIQYGDYARWEQERYASERLAGTLSWWRESLAHVEELQLPTDRPRPARPSHRGGVCPLALPDVSGLADLCRAADATLFMGLLAAFGAVLGRWSGQAAFPIGTPNANRQRPELAGLIGFFANILVLPVQLGGAPTFRQLLARTRTAVLGAFQHQDVPFDALVDALGAARDPSRNPLFQVMFALHSESLERLRLPGLEVEPVPLGTERTHFDLGMHLWHREGRVHGYLSYATDLFDPATALRMVTHVARLAEAAVAAPDVPLSSLPLLWEEEARWLSGAAGDEPAPPLPIAPGEGVRRWLPDSCSVPVGHPDEAGAWMATSPERLRAALDAGTAPAGLVGVLCVGGPLPAELARRAARVFGAPVYTAWQPFGEEIVAWHRAGPDDRGPWVPVGRPDRRRVQVRESGGSLAPIGVLGRVEVDGRPLPEPGRWRPDGALELHPEGARSLQYQGARLDLDALGLELARRAGCVEAHVALRIAEGEPCWVAWAVPARRVDRRQVEQVAAALLPAPRAVGILTRLPRDAEGRVDQAALDALPLLDDVVARRFAGALVASGASDAAATLQPAPPAAGERLHLWDMVPELARSAEVESTSSTEQGASRAEAEVPLPAGPVAWHDGGPLSVPEDAPRTLSEALLLAARRSEATGRGLTVVESGRGSRQRSYARLVDDARAVLGGLQAAGLRPGDRLVLQLPSLHDHFTAFWACVLGGITPVTVAPPPSYDLPNAVLAKLFNAWRLLRHPPVLTHADRQAPLARAAASYAADDAVPFRTLAFETLASGEPGELHAASPEDLVFFQLTSGSTGIPKCVPETHRAVSRHVLGATAFNRYGPDDCSVNWLPLDHVVPTLTSHLRDVFLGIPQVHAETAWVLADPLRWLDLLEEHRATITWSPNFGFKLVSQAVAANPHRRWDLSRVRSMMNAGEQVTLAVVEELLARTAAFGIRPEAMQPAYGMAEVATAVTFRNGFSLETATCRVRKASLGALLEDATPDEVGSVAFIDNGPPIPGVELRIADHRGRALPERMIGRIQMRGGVVNPGYLDNPEANADAFVGDGWFDSGDLGFFRDRHLFITGRRKEIIIVRGANFYCYEIEDVVNAVEGVEPSFAAVTSIDDPASGTEGLAVFFVPRTAGAGVNARLVAAVREAVTRTFGVRPAFTLPLNREEFPKTTSGKIQRADLKKRLAAGDLDARIREVDRAEAAPTTVPSWFSRPGWAPRPPSDRPFDLAGTWLVDLGADLLSGARALDLAAATAELAAGATPAAVVVPCAGDGAALLPLVQAILASSAPPHLIVLAPEGGAAVGLVLTLAQENPAVRCRVVEGVGGVDLAAAIRAKPASAGADGRAVEGVRGVDLAAAIQAELASPGAEPRVRWSNGRREVRRLRPFVPGGSALPLRRGGAYVLVGGLGGVGRALAAMLLRRFEARLLLLGRTPLEGGAAADADLETLAASASGEERRNALAALARLPGEVTYVPLDASDPDAVRAALARWGHPPDGAFHLAGRFPIRLLAEERAEGWRAVHHSKVDTFAALDAALPSGAFIVAMGSVYAELGTAAGGAYASAGSALAAAAAARATRGAPTWHVAWSHWDDVGMSRSFAFREEARALGLHMLAPSEALTSLLAVLAGPPGDVVVGLDPACPHAGWRTDLPAAPAEAVIAAAAGGSGRPAPVPDRLGRPIQGTILSCEQVPRGVDGALDVEALGALASGGAAARPYAAPSSALERTIAAAWCEALGVERVDVDTSYFALGGQSVQLVQVLARLEASLGRKLSVVDLFRWPTVRGLARFLAQAEGGGEQARLEQAQDRGRRLRQVRRTAPTHGKPR